MVISVNVTIVPFRYLSVPLFTTINHRSPVCLAVLTPFN